MSIPRNAPPLSHIAAGPRPAPVNRINLLEAVSRGSARAQLPTPIGPIRRRPGGFLPESPAPEFRFQRAGDQTKSRAAELARVGKMTSITQILSLLSRPTSYRTYSHGMALLVDGIRQLSLQKQFSVANRFGCATAEDLANRLLFLFRKKGLEEKALEVAAQRKAGTKRKPQGRIWAAGGGFWEEIVRMDEALTAILRKLAADEFVRLRQTSRAIAMRPGKRGKFVKTEVKFSDKAEFSPVFRSVEVATKLKGGEKLYDSIDDLHAVIVKDGGKQYLVVLVRAQIKREAAAQKLGKQTDIDLTRLTSEDLDALVLKDLIGENNAALSFTRDQILFVETSASRPIGIVQNSSVIGDSGKRVIREDTFKTPKDVEVTRLSVGVDVELHDKLLELVFISGRLIR